MALIISMPAKPMMKISACMIEKKGGESFFPFSFFQKLCEKFHKKILDEVVTKIVKDFTKNLDERLLVNFFTKKIRRISSEEYFS